MDRAPVRVPEDPLAFFFLTLTARFLYPAERLARAITADLRKRIHHRVSVYELLGEMVNFGPRFFEECIPLVLFDINATALELLLSREADGAHFIRFHLCKEDSIHRVGAAGRIYQELRFLGTRTLELITGLGPALIIDQQHMAVLEPVDAIDTKPEPQAECFEVGLLFDGLDNERLLARALDSEP